MNLVLRILLLILIVPPAAFFLASIFSMPLVLTGLHHSMFAMTIAELLGVIATIPIVVFVLRARVDDTAMGLRTAVRMGAIIVGSIGFIGGIVWMEIYYPKGDLNFLMGPIAGSFGFVLGALVGLLYWLLIKLDGDKEK